MLAIGFGLIFEGLFHDNNLMAQKGVDSMPGDDHPLVLMPLVYESRWSVKMKNIPSPHVAVEAHPILSQ